MKEKQKREERDDAVDHHAYIFRITGVGYHDLWHSVLNENASKTPPAHMYSST